MIESRWDSEFGDGVASEGKADGSVPAVVDAVEAGWRLAAIADGLESILYLGLFDVERARGLLSSALARELAQ